MLYQIKFIPFKQFSLVKSVPSTHVYTINKNNIKKIKIYLILFLLLIKCALFEQGTCTVFQGKCAIFQGKCVKNHRANV